MAVLGGDLSMFFEGARCYQEHLVSWVILGVQFL